MSHMKNQPSQSAKREELDKFVVRLPDGMRELIADKAKEQRRSMNMEIIQRLVDSFEADVELQRLQAALDDAHFRIRSLQEQVQGAAA